MKFLKNMLIIALLCTLGSMNAKIMRQTTTTPTIPMTPYFQLVEFVKTAPNAWDMTTNMLSQQFIADLHTRSHAAQLDSVQFNALLDMARGYRAPFTSDNAKNTIIETNYQRQKEDAIRDYKATPSSAQPSPNQPSGEQPQVTNQNIAEFVEKLVQANEEKIKHFAETTPLMEGEMSDTFSPIIEAITTKYPETDKNNQRKAAGMLIDKITDKFKDLSEERSGNMKVFIRTKINYWQEFSKVQ